MKIEPLESIDKSKYLAMLLMYTDPKDGWLYYKNMILPLDADASASTLAVEDGQFTKRLLYWTGGDKAMASKLFKISKRNRDGLDIEGLVDRTYNQMTGNGKKKPFLNWPTYDTSDEKRFDFFLTVLEAKRCLLIEDIKNMDHTKDQIAKTLKRDLNGAPDLIDKAKKDAEEAYKKAVSEAGDDQEKLNQAEKDKKDAIADAVKKAKERKDGAYKTAKKAFSSASGRTDARSVLAYRDMLKDGVYAEKFVTWLLETVHFAFTYVKDPSEVTNATPLRYYDPSQGIWDFDPEKFEAMMRVACNLYKKSDFENFVTYFKTVARRKALRLRQQGQDGVYIAVKNGVLDTVKLELNPFSPKYVLTSKTLATWRGKTDEPHYGKSVYGPNHDQQWSFTQFLKEKANGDELKYKLLWQIVRAGVTGDTRTRKIVLLVDNPDDGHTGKSTFEDVLAYCVGQKYTASLKLNEMNDENARAALIGAKLVVGDDVDAHDTIKVIGYIKPIASGDQILVKILYKDKIRIIPMCFCIQSINGRPDFQTIDGPTIDRLTVVVFADTQQYDITSEDSKAVKLGAYGEKPFIAREDFKSWLLYEALTNPLAQGPFVETEESKRELDIMRKAGDPIKEFLDDYMPKLDSVTLPTAFLYNYFCASQAMEGRKVDLSKPKFVATLMTYKEFAQEFELKKDIKYASKERPFFESDADTLLDLYNSTRWGKDLKTFFPLMTEAVKQGEDITATRRKFDEDRMDKIMNGHGQCFVRKHPDLSRISPVKNQVVPRPVKK